jgi:predicted GNAT superfamily acetyltransferase
VEGTDTGVPGDVLLVQVPLDFYRMLRETDVADPAVRRIPVDWRQAAREVFLGLFARGYRVVDFLKAGGRVSRNFYVLKKESS